MSQSATESSRRFRFFQFNDLHIRQPRLLAQYPTYASANAKAEWAVRCARGESPGIEAPEFVASVGDILHGELPDMEEDFVALHDMVIEPLGRPFLPCLGNHENRQGEGNATLNAAYDRQVGAAWHNYVYTRGGLAFIVVDSSGVACVGAGVAEARNAFLRRALAYVAGMPTLVLTHVPMLPMREPAVLAASFGFSSWYNTDAAMLAIVEAHREQVIAVLNGHLHITAVRHVAGIAHIVPSGTAGYPADFASYDVHADHIAVRMHRVPDALLVDGDLGNIHGVRRHGKAFTDADHATHEAYLSGNPDERDFVLPLTGGRRLRGPADAPLTVYHEVAPDVWQVVSHRLTRPGAGSR